MNIEQLINKSCPEGVEMKPLWSVTIWDKNFTSVDRYKQSKVINYPYLLAADLFALEKEYGNVFLLSTGERTGWTTEELAGNKLREGEVITIPWGKSRDVVDCIKYYKGKFVTADNRIMTSSNVDVLSNRFIYHWVISKGKVIDTFYRGSGIKHPDMCKVLDLQIPIPPIHIQQEIINILDGYSITTAKLKKELQAELQARKSQYEYYRNQLLSFSDIDNSDSESNDKVEWMKLEDVCKINRGVRVVRNDLQKTGGYPVYQNSMTPLGYFSKKNCPANTVFIISAGAAGEIGYSYNDFWAADDCYCLICPNSLISRYLYYVLKSKQVYFSSNVRRASVPRLAKQFVERFELPIPSLSEQARIVSILDRFDKLCNDLSEGLPAEIEARQKQYEYYRDKLLTFKEKI